MIGLGFMASVVVGTGGAFLCMIRAGQKHYSGLKCPADWIPAIMASVGLISVIVFGILVSLSF